MSCIFRILIGVLQTGSQSRAELRARNAGAARPFKPGVSKLWLVAVLMVFVLTPERVALFPSDSLRPTLGSGWASRSLRLGLSPGRSLVQESPVLSDRVSDAVARFEEWVVDALTNGIHALSTEDLTTGEALALERHEQLREIIRTDPRRALAAAVPFARRSRLPDSITRHLEERVSGRGSLSVMVATDFKRKVSEVRREAVLQGRRYKAFVHGSRRFQPSRKDIPFHGVAVDDLLAVAESPVRPLEAGEPLPAGSESRRCPVSASPADVNGTPIYADIGGQMESLCGAQHLVLLEARLAGNQAGATASRLPLLPESWSLGPKTCLFMRVAFPDDPTEPISEKAAYAVMDNVNRWYVENSYGTTSLTPTVTPLLMLPYAKDYYTVESNVRLLEDARHAARQAGFDTDDYDWDMVRHSAVPGFDFGGAALIGEKGIWLQDSSVGVVCHELGHNYGLWHANSWNSINDSVIGIGTHSEYGNRFDTMGVPEAGNHHFNAAFKNQLHWLGASFVENITNSGTYRLHAFDIPALTPTRKYALRVNKNYSRNYWVEHRQKFDNRWFLGGIILNWDPWSNGVHDSVGGTHLLDTTPGTPEREKDCAVVLGRTFSDLAAGVHLTPVAKGSLSPENWIDVVVNIGEFPGNRPPVASLTADRVAAQVNEPIHLSIVASDPDAEPLAYYWDFGDATFGQNEASAIKSWLAAGEYTVRCVVSDMKGGIVSRFIVVSIGSPATFRLSGRVITEGGLPVEGVRVHNGNSSIFYRGAYTDSDGRYALANVRAGSIRISTVKYGYTLRSTGWSNPVRVGPDATNLDFLAVPDPAISLAATTARTTEAGLVPGRVTIARRGQTNAPLVVKLNRSGSALPDIDYTTTPIIEGNPLQVTFPAGATSLAIDVEPIADSLGEGPETATFTLIEDAAYIAGGLAEATVTLVDPEPPATVTLRNTAASINEFGGNNSAPEGSEAAFILELDRVLPGPLAVRLEFGGSASNGADYAMIEAIATIPANALSATLPIHPIVDDRSEGDENAILRVRPDSGYFIGNPATAAITIIDRPFDAWKFTRFTDAELADPVLRGLAGDPDNDRLSNLLEYAFGFEPKIADTKSGFHGRLEALPEGPAYVVTFHRRKRPTDIEYELEVSRDLRNWQSGSDQIIEILPARDDGNGITETAEARLLGPLITNGVRFIRLKVSLSPGSP